MLFRAAAVAGATAASTTKTPASTASASSTPAGKPAKAAGDKSGGMSSVWAQHQNQNIFKRMILVFNLPPTVTALQARQLVLSKCKCFLCSIIVYSYFKEYQIELCDTFII